eukprot:3738152-Alexandrium_andersonii.AAC.1
MRRLVLTCPRSTRSPMPRRTAVAPKEATPVSATTPARSATRTGAELGPTGPCATTHGVASRR